MSDPDPNKDECGVVYKISCKKCLENNICTSYIGETGRLKSKRFSEHFRNYVIPPENLNTNTSQVVIHALKEHGRNENTLWESETLARSNVTQKRKVKEAMLIREHKPCLNLNSGLSLII